jgi:hypothetical protein
MNASWVAGAVRARQLARHRLGSQGEQELAACRDLDEALAMLAGTAYEEALRAGRDLEAVQHAVADQALWHLRILAGWVPAGGIRAVQALAAWFEIANVEETVFAISSNESIPPPYQMGRLSLARRGVHRAASLVEVRRALTRTRWGDPGGDRADALLFGVRLAWGELLRRVIRQRRDWGLGLTALVLAQDRFLPGARHPVPRHVAGLGSGWRDATDVESFVAALPARAAWALADVRDATDLWEAEETWWRRVVADGYDLLRHGRLGQGTVVGAAAVIVADARFTRTALDRAYRGGTEAVDHAGV